MAVVTLATEQARPNVRRHAMLGCILKAIDITVGLVSVVAGVFALVAAPPSVVREVSLPFLVVLWGALLIAGGLSSALGRLTGIWILETAGIISATSGTLIYLVVVSTAIGATLGAAVVASFILIALLAMARRYIELQIFLSEPKERGLIAHIQSLLRLRTAPSLQP